MITNKMYNFSMKTIFDTEAEGNVAADEKGIAANLHVRWLNTCIRRGGSIKPKEYLEKVDNLYKSVHPMVV